MPCVRSTSAMSTVTPHTITITRHGIRLIASPSSADRESTRTTAPRNAPMPTLTLREDDAQDQRGDDAERDPVPPVEAVRRIASGDRRTGARATARPNSLRPPNSSVAAERHQRVRDQVVEIGLPLEPRQPVSRHQAVHDDAGRRERARARRRWRRCRP